MHVCSLRFAPVPAGNRAFLAIAVLATVGRVAVRRRTKNPPSACGPTLPSASRRCASSSPPSSRRGATTTKISTARRSSGNGVTTRSRRTLPTAIPYEPGQSEIKRRYVEVHTFRSYSTTLPDMPVGVPVPAGNQPHPVSREVQPEAEEQGRRLRTDDRRNQVRHRRQFLVLIHLPTRMDERPDALVVDAADCASS